MSYMKDLQGNILPLQTKLAQAYTNAAFVLTAFLPEVKVSDEEFQYATFSKDHMKLHSTERAVRGASNYISPEGLTFTDDKVIEHDIVYPIDYREGKTSQRSGILNLKNHATYTISEILGIRKEKEIADLISTAGNYAASNKLALTGNDCWDSSVSAHADSRPDLDIENGKSAINADIGNYPNVAGCDVTTWDALRIHPDVKALFYGTGQLQGVVTPKMFGSYFGFKKFVICAARYYNDDTPAFVNILGDVFIMAYQPQLDSKNRNLITRGFGVTAVMKEYPQVDEFLTEGGKVSNIRATGMWKAFMQCADAAYLTTNTIT